MLNLIATTDKLQVISSAAVTVDVHTSGVDVDTATGNTFTPWKQNTAITTAATTDIVASPASGQVRNIKWISIRNKHASSSNDVTIQFNQNATLFEIIKVTLLAGEELVCREGIWFHLDSTGAVYSQAIAAPVSALTLSADVSNSTTTAAKITGLDKALAVGTYTFRYFIIYQAAATTTGVKFSVNFTGTVTQFVANWYGVDNNALAATAAADQDALAATGQIIFAFAARAKSNAAGWGPTVSVDTANADMLAILEGSMIVTVTGNIELWHASEVAAATTVKAGSNMVITKVG